MNARPISACPAYLAPNSAAEIPEKSAKFQPKASSPLSITSVVVSIAAHLVINTTLAGVAQSVERVALINSKEINLKVVGSSPTFGYSYHKAHQSSCSFAICSFWLVRCVEVDGGSMLYRGWTWLT
jgi:hypothetical protein